MPSSDLGSGEAEGSGGSPCPQGGDHLAGSPDDKQVPTDKGGGGWLLNLPTPATSVVPDLGRVHACLGRSQLPTSPSHFQEFIPKAESRMV